MRYFQISKSRDKKDPYLQGNKVYSSGLILNFIGDGEYLLEVFPIDTPKRLECDIYEVSGFVRVVNRGKWFSKKVLKEIVEIGGIFDPYGIMKIACSFTGELGLFKYIIEELGEMDPYELNYLTFEAAKNGRLRLLKYLNSKFKRRYTDENFLIMMLASKSGKINIVKYIISICYHPNQNELDQLLKASVFHRRYKLISYFFSIGAKEKDAIIIAAKNFDIKAIRILVQNGANINCFDGMAIKIFATHGRLDLIKEIVKIGADANKLKCNLEITNKEVIKWMKVFIKD